MVTHHSLLSAHLDNSRILLVEDNVTNQEVASGLLRRLGWRADVSGNGKEAVRALEAQPYDLVLMDVQMPEMDGYEATRMIRDPRSLVLNHNVPIIATTAHAMSGDAQKCLDAGMSDYISKPIDPKKLAEVVEKWLKRKVHCVDEKASVQAASVVHPAAPELRDEVLVFNRESFLTRMMKDEGLAREIATTFLEELPALLGKLKEALDRKDLDAVWKQAHKLKGSAANVGGEALQDVASHIEKAGKAGDLTEVVNRIADLESHAERLGSALQQFTKVSAIPQFN